MKRKFLYFVLILILATTLFPVPRKMLAGFFNDQFKNVSIFLSDASTGLKNKFQLFAMISKIKQDNETLSEKLTELEVDKSELLELKKENELLKKELGFIGEEDKGMLLPAKIIQRDPISYLDYMIIDKGLNDGVKENAAVTSSGVLIGQVKEVYEKTAKVTLITSKDSIIQAMLQGSRSKGILHGGISGIFLDNIIYDTEYQPGEYIVTSGLGGKHKAGILIGKAGKIRSTSSDVYKSIQVEPIIEYSKLELVLVQK